MKTLIITGTHGDEQFCVPVVRPLRKIFAFDWISGNPRAKKQNVRFTQSDLNRSGPGNSKSKLYEERRAKYVIDKASQYEQVIDIHGTISNSGIFIIVSDPNWQNVELAKRLPIKRVVLWPSLRSQGPLTQFIPNSLEIECGPKNSPLVAKELKKILSKFLSGNSECINQDFYIVTGQIKSDLKLKFVDFEPANYQGLSFIPLLVDQYPGIKCYTLQKLKNTLEF